MRATANVSVSPSFDNVKRMPNARHDDLGCEVVIPVNLDGLLDEIHAGVADIVESTDEGTDERRTRLGSVP